MALTFYLSLTGCIESGAKCSELLERIAQRCERDDAGRGNLFAPGLALALTLSQILQEPISSRWMVEFRDATGMQTVIWPQVEPFPSAAMGRRKQ